MSPATTPFRPAKSKPDKGMAKTRPAAHKAEQRLAAQAQAGDPAAMRRLLEELSIPIYKFGRRFCRNEEDAQDVMQESLAALVRTLPRWRGESALSTWAYSVARNTCGRMRRRRAGAPERLESLEDEATNAAALRIASPGPDPAREFERASLRAALDAALAELPAAQREVVVLRDVEGLSTREVAQTLGLAEEAVKSRLHRGRLALRRTLASERGETMPARRTGCPDTARMLSLHLEGELDAATCRRLSAHVEQCPDCKHACTTLRRTLTACARLGEAAVPAATRATIRRAIKAVIEADGAAEAG